MPINIKTSPYITYLIPCWMSPELLTICIPSLIKSLTLPSQIIIILNEYDKKSVEICTHYGVEFITTHINYGPAGVDLALPMIRGEYVANVNSDMLFYPGWDKPIYEKLVSNKICTVSPILVEPQKNTPWIHFNPSGFSHEANKKFTQFIEQGGPNQQTAFGCGDRVSYNHPIFVHRDIHTLVGGYSNNFNKDWMERTLPKCRGLDNDYACRIWEKTSGTCKFIATWDSFVYHASNLNTAKIAENKPSAEDLFQKDHGMSTAEFDTKIKYWKLILGKQKTRT